MSTQAFLEQVRATPLSTAVRESSWIFPTVESIHCWG
jgi:hypothetical protein